MKRILTCLILLVFLTGCSATTVRPTIGEAVTAPPAATTTAETTSASTAAPTEVPTTAPTAAPTEALTTAPTAASTEAPTAAPTEEPTTVPAEPATTIPADNAQREFTYILNTNTKKFHYGDCHSVEKIKDENKDTFTGTRWELIELGYKPCGNCDP